MSRDQLAGDELVTDAVLRNIEIIGEAAKNQPDDVRARMPGIEWKKIAGMRDWLSHVYYRVDPEIVGEAVETNIPELSPFGRHSASGLGRRRTPGSEPRGRTVDARTFPCKEFLGRSEKFGKMLPIRLQSLRNRCILYQNRTVRESAARGRGRPVSV